MRRKPKAAIPKMTRRRPRPTPRPDAISRAAELIDASERPLILAGQGVIASGSGELLREFAEKTGVPVASTLLGLAWREIIPWWLVGVLLAREVFMGVVVLVAKRHGWVGLPVHFAGKAATFNLLYAFPLILLGEGTSTLATIAQPVGWAFAWWGTGLYWVAGILYAVQLRQLIAAQERAVPA